MTLEKPSAHRFALPALVVLLLIAFAVGGGGSRFALANLAVQLAALVVLALQPTEFMRFWHQAPISLRSAIIAVCLLPLLQTIPLPEAVWTSLPGRDLVTRAVTMTGESGWMTFSVDPRRTILALTALITPFAVIIAGWALPRRRLIDCGWLVVALGLVTTVIGMVQLAAPNPDTSLFSDRDNGSVLLGTFANRNSTGLLLGFALGLAALLPVPRPQLGLQIARVAVCAILLLAIVLTKSRTALVLAAIPSGLGGLRILWWALRERPNQSGRPPASGARMVMIIAAAFALCAAVIGALVVAAPGRIGETLERFEAKDDPRRFIWDDATYTVGRYWPAGAGVGTFDEVFQVDESLENLTRRRAGRAHNDYIELAIEAGLPGLALAAGWLLLIGWLSWRARRSSLRWVAWGGSGFLFAIALQSITDYPLRNQTMLAFAGLALVMLARGSHGDEQRSKGIRA